MADCGEWLPNFIIYTRLYLGVWIAQKQGLSFMRILFVNTGPWGTGSFTVIKDLTKELLKFGHTVKILFPAGRQRTP